MIYAKSNIGVMKMLLDFEKTLVREDWYVKEMTAPLFVRVYYVLGGHVTYRDENVELTLQKGHVYLFPTSIPYSMEQDKEDRLSCIFLHLDIMPKVIQKVVSIDCSAHPVVNGIIEAIDGSLAWGRKEGEALMIPLAEALTAYAEQCGMIQSGEKGLDQAVAYIAEHYAQEITVSELSAMCGYHQKYFIRIFKSVFGISPYQYLIYYRLRRSCYLLREGKSVAETAYLCGYKEAKAYCRAFREKFGVSPGKFANAKWIVP